MSNSLRDQLLGLGFKSSPRPAPPKPPVSGFRPKQTNSKGSGKHTAKTGTPQSRRNTAKSQDEIDLARAYAIRAQREKQEQIEAERQKQEAARARREAQAKLAALLDGKALNAPDADIARHFEYGGKIKRVYVTAEQLKALNSGKLGVVQHNGRYVLVTAEVLAEAEAIFAPAIALKVDPAAPAADDPYSDPKYQVPDDLVW